MKADNTGFATYIFDRPFLRFPTKKRLFQPKIQLFTGYFIFTKSKTNGAPYTLNSKMEITSLQTFILIFSIFLVIYSFFFFNNSRNSKSTTRFGFKNYPIFGTLPEFILNRHRFLEWSTQVLSKCPTNTAIFCRPGKINGVITANPSNVEHILKTNFDNYPKGTRFISLLEDFIGRGIFNSDGEAWRTQRKTASYEFNTRSLRNFVLESAGVELHNRFIPVLEKAGDLNRVIDIQELLERCTI